MYLCLFIIPNCRKYAGKLQPEKYPELNQNLSVKSSTEMEYIKLHKCSVYCRLTVLGCITIYCVHLLFCVFFGRMICLTHGAKLSEHGVSCVKSVLCTLCHWDTESRDKWYVGVPFLWRWSLNFSHWDSQIISLSVSVKISPGRQDTTPYVRVKERKSMCPFGQSKPTLRRITFL